jgi:hypothetical protein
MDYKFLTDIRFIQNKAPATAAALEKKLKVHSVVLQGIIMTNRPSFHGKCSVHCHCEKERFL